MTSAWLFRLRRAHRVLPGALMGALMGCYSYAPLPQGVTPALGERYALRISDSGRASLGERFGPGLLLVDGRLAELSPAAFGLEVFRVEHLGNQTSTWAGEKVTVERTAVAQVDRRVFSRGRTAVLVGATAGLMGYLVFSRGLFGFYTGDQPETPVPPVESSVGLSRSHR